DTFDIHGGGQDLIFPHHENEIAQSEGASGKPLANYWVHNGFVNIDKEKMSKSLGNFLTIRELLEDCHPEILRFFVVANHYRSPIDFSQENMAVAAAGLERLYQSLDRLLEKASASGAGESSLDDRIEAWRQKFIAAMDDDFNSAAAVAVLFDISKEINRWLDDEKTAIDPQAAARVAGLMREIGEPLGLLQTAPRDFLQRTSSETDGRLEAAEIESLIAERAAARKERNWAEADRVRDILEENGIILKDSAEGTKWQRKR
ncbi:MAG: class I tRNA ligase family protein, partial [Deltaproteobacteria bacterium]|nr:class I tRNA ligase family protein [Candidatus Tharpella sp.]